MSRRNREGDSRPGRRWGRYAERPIHVGLVPVPTCLDRDHSNHGESRTPGYLTVSSCLILPAASRTTRSALS